MKGIFCSFVGASPFLSGLPWNAQPLSGQHSWGLRSYPGQDGRAWVAGGVETIYDGSDRVGILGPVVQNPD